MSSQIQQNPKAAHYHQALTSALLRGAWADANPGQAPNGTELSWGELVRKWGKHTGGNTALIHHLRDISLLYLSSTSHAHPVSSSVFVSLPSQPSAQHNTSPEGTTDGASGESFVHVSNPRKSHDAPASTSSGTVAGTTAAAGGGTAKAYLSASDLDGDEADDDGQRGEGTAWWSGVATEQEGEVREGIKALEGLLASGNLREKEVPSARLILAYHHHALGQHEQAVRLFDEGLAGDPTIGVVHGDAAVLERVRGTTLKGISLELLSAQSALHTYLSFPPLLRSFTSFPLAIPSYLLAPSAKAYATPFDTHRELHRHLSTGLSRAAILSARTASIPDTLRILRTYSAFSASYPSSFRPSQRQRLLLLYLRALVSSRPPPNTTPSIPYTLTDSPLVSPPRSARQLWTSEVLAALQFGERLLTQTTTFPRAGSVNWPVLRFVRFAVHLSDCARSTVIAKEAINILWWAQTLTFQSQGILRHLTRLLTQTNQHSDARRTFELYVQLVLKARETAQPEVSLQLKRRPTDDAAASPREIQAQVDEADADDEEKKGQAAEAEVDGDREFVQALLGGTRLLCKELEEVEEGWRYACLAGDVLDAAESRGRGLGGRIRGEVEEAKGVVRMAMAMRGADPVTRPIYQAQAINHLLSASSLLPQSGSAFYHLAFAQAEARQVDKATESVRVSLELESRNVQAWHLLALLLTAQADWEDAAKAGEAGVAVWEGEEERLAAEEGDDGTPVDGPGGAGEELDPNVEARDFGAAPTSPADPTAPSRTIAPLLLPTGAFSPLRPPPTSLPPRDKRLEHVIQLRMTLNFIAEKTWGAQEAMQRHQEVMAFCAARTGPGRHLAAGGRGSVMSVGGQSVGGESRVNGGGGGGGGLGGSYVSVDDGGAMVGSVNVVPPTPDVSTYHQNLGGASNVPQIVQSVSSSPGNTTPSDREEMLEEQASVKSGKRSVRGATRAMVRHLHVPKSGGGGSHGHASGKGGNRVVSTGGPGEYGGLQQQQISRNRQGSTSSTALSLAPTAVHSHYHHSPTSSQHPSPVPPPSDAAPPSDLTPAERRLRSNLWLMSAATLRRSQRPASSLVAINEAELLDPENPDVWVQLGLYHLSSHPPNHTAAQPAFTKSLLLRPDHPPAIVNLAKLYIATGQIELAHSLLNQLTQDRGWDCAEAWYYLGKVCEMQGAGREERARECWMYALGLEKGRPARGLEDGVERWL